MNQYHCSLCGHGDATVNYGTQIICTSCGKAKERVFSSRKGIPQAHNNSANFRNCPERAAECGRKGGLANKRRGFDDKAIASAAGKKGGQTRAKNKQREDSLK